MSTITGITESTYVTDLLRRVGERKSDTFAVFLPLDGAKMLSERFTKFQLLEAFITCTSAVGERRSLSWSGAKNQKLDAQYAMVFDQKGGDNRDDVRYALYRDDELIACGETDESAFAYFVVMSERMSSGDIPYLVAFAFGRGGDEPRTALLKGCDEQALRYVLALRHQLIDGNGDGSHE
jgi:hypothetical protein